VIARANAGAPAAGERAPRARNSASSRSGPNVVVTAATTGGTPPFCVVPPPEKQATVCRWGRREHRRRPKCDEAGTGNRQDGLPVVRRRVHDFSQLSRRTVWSGGRPVPDERILASATVSKDGRPACTRTTGGGPRVGQDHAAFGRHSAQGAAPDGFVRHNKLISCDRERSDVGRQAF